MVTHRFTLTFALLLMGLGSPSLAQRIELLDFYLPGCGPCRAMEPVIGRLAAEGVPVRKVNGSQEPRLAQQLRVESYPTFVLVSDGREVGRVVGATSYEHLRGLLSRATPPSIQPAAATTFAPAANSLTTTDVGNAFAVGGDHGPGLPPTAMGPTTTTSAPGLIASSVRLTVEDPNGRSHGAGTVVDARQGEALVITCAHLFRGPDGKAIDTTGRLTVELFDASAAGARVSERVAGALVAYDFDADVALVAIRPTTQVKPARVAATAASIVAGAAVRSVGCDLGADPTVRDSQIVTIDRYDGAPNIETTGAPVQGRSGGGLFNSSGELIGVCFAADEQANEGLYAGLASIHRQLDRIGLTGVYQSATQATTLAASPNQPNTAPTAAGELSPVPRGQDTNASAVFRGQNDPAPLPANEQATLEEIIARGDGSEVVVLIRPEGGGPTEVMTLDSASAEFVAALRKMRGESEVAIR